MTDLCIRESRIVNAVFYCEKVGFLLYIGTVLIKPEGMMISVDKLTFLYSLKTHAGLENLSFELPQRAYMAVVGRNGSGKSTLFRLLTGQFLPQQGNIEINGWNTRTQRSRIRRIIGTVFQSPSLDGELSVLENLNIHGQLYGLQGQHLKNRVQKVLEGTDLKTRLNDKVCLLSGGLARQVELAKCLLSEPSVVFLDEPTSGLDPVARTRFLNILSNIRDIYGVTICMTTHVASDVEQVDHVLVLSSGSRVAFETPEKLREGMPENMVILHLLPTTDDQAICETLRKDYDLSVDRYPNEIRFPLIPSRVSLDRVFEQYGSNIARVSAKKTDMEDVLLRQIKG